MRETIREKYNDLVDDLRTSYNKVKVIDNYDWNEYSPYTIFYLNKNESFDKFEDLWTSVVENGRDLDLSYDDILLEFETKARETFDYIELGTLDCYTDSEFELNI